MTKFILIISLLFSLPAFGAGSAPRATAAEERISAAEVALMPNILINGNWDLWQRGTSQTQATVTSAGTGYGVGAADRWYVNWGTIPTAYTFSRQAATPGELSGEPTYYARMAVTTIGGGAGIRIEQHIESARSLAGKSATLSFWGKNTVAVQPIIDVQQVFGTGGSPSGATTITCATLPAMTTTWTKYTATCAIPSVSGKTFGTTSGTDYLNIRIRMTDVNQQFDIAQVMLNEGTRAAPFKLAGGNVGGELVLAQRYYEKSYPITSPPASTMNSGEGLMQASSTTDLDRTGIYFQVTKRVTPAVRVYAISPATIDRVQGHANAVSLNGSYSSDKMFVLTSTGLTVGNWYIFQWTADAELP